MIQFEKGKIYQAEVKEAIGDDDLMPFEFMYLNKLGKGHFVLLEPRSIMPQDEDGLKEILNMTPEDIADGDAYFVNPSIDEEIVFWEEGEVMLTSLGYEIINIKLKE